MNHDLIVINQNGKIVKSKYYRVLISNFNGMDMYFYPANGIIYGETEPVFVGKMPAQSILPFTKL